MRRMGLAFQEVMLSKMVANLKIVMVDQALKMLQHAPQDGAFNGEATWDTSSGETVTRAPLSRKGQVLLTSIRVEANWVSSTLQCPGN